MAERVGFHSNFGIFRQRGHSLEGFSIALIIHSLEGFSIALIIHSLEGFSIALIIHSLDPLRLAIINGFPFNPTYVLKLQSRDDTGAVPYS